MPGTTKSKYRDTAGEAQLWARIHSFRRGYSISRSRREPVLIDDEASLIIASTIVELPKRYAKHSGMPFEVHLLSARRNEVADGSGTGPSFFGTVSLRRNQLSALAYLPPRPFWALPAIIDGGAEWLWLQFSLWRGGSGDLNGMALCDEQERRELLALAGGMNERGSNDH